MKIFILLSAVFIVCPAHAFIFGPQAGASYLLGTVESKVGTTTYQTGGAMGLPVLGAHLLSSLDSSAVSFSGLASKTIHLKSLVEYQTLAFETRAKGSSATTSSKSKVVTALGIPMLSLGASFYAGAGLGLGYASSEKVLSGWAALAVTWYFYDHVFSEVRAQFDLKAGDRFTQYPVFLTVGVSPEW